MAPRSVVAAVYPAGVVQGLALVTFPAAGPGARARPGRALRRHGRLVGPAGPRRRRGAGLAAFQPAPAPGARPGGDGRPGPQGWSAGPRRVLALRGLRAAVRDRRDDERQ